MGYRYCRGVMGQELVSNYMKLLQSEPKEFLKGKRGGGLI